MQYQLLSGKNVAKYLTLDEMKFTEQGRGRWLNEMVKDGGGTF